MWKGALVHVPREPAFRKHIPVTLVISCSISQKINWKKTQLCPWFIDTSGGSSNFSEGLIKSQTKLSKCLSSSLILFLQLLLVEERCWGLGGGGRDHVTAFVNNNNSKGPFQSWINLSTSPSTPVFTKANSKAPSDLQTPELMLDICPKTLEGGTVHGLLCCCSLQPGEMGAGPAVSHNQKTPRGASQRCPPSRTGC